MCIFCGDKHVSSQSVMVSGFPIPEGHSMGMSVYTMSNGESWVKSLPSLFDLLHNRAHYLTVIPHRH